MFDNLKKSGHDEIHTLPIGAGVFKQSVLVSITLQAIAALQAGFDLNKLIFHEVSDNQKEIVEAFLSNSAKYLLSTEEMIQHIYLLGKEKKEDRKNIKFTEKEQKKLGQAKQWQAGYRANGAENAKEENIKNQSQQAEMATSSASLFIKSRTNSLFRKQN